MFFFIATIALITLRTFTEYGNGIGIHLSELDFASKTIGILTIFFAFATYASKTKNQINNVLPKIVFFILILSTVNGLKNFELDFSLAAELIRLISIYSFYVLASRFTYIPTSKIRRFLIIACTIPGGVVILTFLTGRTVFRTESIRATGTFSHANSAAAYLGLSALICLAIFFQERRILFLSFFLLNMIAVSLTQSLTALVGVVFALSILLLDNPRIKSNTKSILILILASSALFLSIIFKNKLKDLITIDYKTIFTSGSFDSSIGWRVLNWNLYIKQWQESPILGFGPGSTSAHFTPLGSIPHSAIVFLLVEYGLVGLVIASFSFLVLVWQLRKSKQRDGLDFYTSLPLGVYLAILSLTSNILTYTSALFLAAFVLGIASQVDSLAKDELERKRK